MLISGTSTEALTDNVFLFQDCRPIESVLALAFPGCHRVRKYGRLDDGHEA